MFPLVRLAIRSPVEKKCANRDVFVVGHHLWWKGKKLRTLDDNMTIALNREGHLEDGQLDLDNTPQLVSEEHENGNELAWEYKNWAARKDECRRVLRSSKSEEQETKRDSLQKRVIWNMARLHLIFGCEI